MTHVQSAVDMVDRVRASGAIAILRLREHTHTVAVARTLLDNGLPVMEVTFDHPDGPDALRTLAAQLPDHAVLGAGTIMHPDQVEQCRDAGGRFCVSPHTDPDLIRAVLAAGLEPIPGAHTATEVATAIAAGARLVKLFPAGPLGYGYLRALAGPFREVMFLPTGGIRHDEVASWLHAGAVAVGLGSDLVPPAPTDDDLPAIGRRARSVADQVARTRQGREAA
jgi:2-dehydro-3-deoxyphosphogluconate aldolase / (4S)-4-hydroxy-2-oxoglutarate aldolase